MRKTRWRKKYGIVAAPVILMLLVFWISLPAELFDDPLSTVVYDREGELLGARIAADGQWRFPGIDSVPVKYSTALVAFEDRYFYLHPGVNPGSLLRALFLNLKAGEIRSGGSTITMQVMRMSRKGKSRNIGQKIIEAWLALRYEVSATKEEILNTYADNAPFGGNVVGLEAAAWRYFGTSPHNLTWSEAALLAVLPNAPALIHPGRNRDALQQKRDRLLVVLRNRGEIDSLTCRMAIEEPLPREPLPLPNLAPHLADGVMLEKDRDRLHSTLDRRLQERIVELTDIRQEQLRANEVHNMACLVVEVETGEVLAYVGNSSARQGGEHGNSVDVIPAPRSSGSILKPILFAGMLDNGDILPATLVPDVPVRYYGYAPKNYDRQYEGAVPAFEALSRSLNIPSVIMLNNYGVDPLLGLLRKLGFTTLTHSHQHYGLTLILGGGETTLWELAGVYSSMARVLNHYTGGNGNYFPSDYHMPVLEKTTPDPGRKDRADNNNGPGPGRLSGPATPPGSEQADRPRAGSDDGPGSNDAPGRNEDAVPGNLPGSGELQEEGLLSASSIWLTFKSLLEVNRPEELSLWYLLSSSRNIAWKTGTSYGFRDAWAVGVTPEYLVAVWAGNADGEGRPGLSGITAAAPLMFDVFSILPSTTWFRAPLDDLEEAEVCRQSGYLAGPWCNERDTIQIVPRGTETPRCPFHRLIHTDRDGAFRVNSECYPVRSMKTSSWFVLPPLMEWYYERNHPAYKTLPPVMEGCVDGSVEELEIVYPEWDSHLVIPRELDGSRGKVVLEVAHRHPATRVFWHVDEAYAGTTQHTHQLALYMEPGTHRLTVVDADGNRDEVRFEVLK